MARRISFHHSVSVERQVPIPMRDGVCLTADIYRPKHLPESQSLPVLLMRLPYGRAIASTVTYAHPSWYANQGYIVVIQDVRGCGTSAGEFYPFRAEYEDGYDTVRWCAEELSGSSGKVGMYGFSYQGVTQFQAAVMQPPGLVTICPAMATADLYQGWFYFGGAMCLDFNLTWGLQLTQNRAQVLKQEPTATNIFRTQQEISKYLQHTPLATIPPLKDEPLGQFFFDWVNHRAPDAPYWQELNPLSRFENYDLPALHIAGWADLFIEATINTYDAACRATSQPQHLIAGPWQHMPWVQQVGELDFGPGASSQIDRLQVAWFDYWLKGIDQGVMAALEEGETELPRRSVQLFLMGENCWINHAAPTNHALPRATAGTESSEQLTFYLAEDFHLELEPVAESETLPDIYTYDPRIPTPSTSYGFYDQQGVQNRWDLLVYCSGILTKPLAVVGIAECTLYAATTAVATDWVVKLLDIYPDGREILIGMGVLRTSERDSVIPDEIHKYIIPLRPTAQVFATGHRLGLTISSAAFPLIERHSNTDLNPNTVNVSDFVEATQRIHHSGQYPSQLRLPVADVD